MIIGPSWSNCRVGLEGAFGMARNNSPDSLYLKTHLTVQAAAEVSGYNAQYLRRLLRQVRRRQNRPGLVDQESIFRTLPEARKDKKTTGVLDQSQPSMTKKGWKRMSLNCLLIGCGRSGGNLMQPMTYRPWYPDCTFYDQRAIKPSQSRCHTLH